MTSATGLMASEDMIAIAFVVDSSAALAAEWSSILQGYIMPMLRRLGETNPQEPRSISCFRVAFVTYELLQRLGGVLPAFREDPSKLGMGQTSCGGDMGMAALEGFVAALELFDLLRQSAQAKNLPYPPAYHIFHLAAAMPDTAERPQCNLSPILDSVTWDSLPSEMKKRNIHLSSINIRQNFQNSRICILYTSSLVPPWFAVRPQHTVLLAGYATIPQKGVKRPGEPMATTPDAKRPKISPPNTNPSPKTTQASPAPPPVSPASAPPSTANAIQFAQQRLQQIYNALRMAEQSVRALQAAISEAREKGDTQTVNTLMPQWTEKSTQYLKLKQTIQPLLAQHSQQRAAFAHAQQAMAAQQVQAAQVAAQANAQQGHMGQPGQQGQGQQGQGLHQGQPAGQPAPQGQGQAGQMSQSVPTAQNDSDVQMSGVDGSTGSNTNQMQKMIEQKERARQNTVAIKQNSVPVWQGLMTWSGTNPAGVPREVSSFVMRAAEIAKLGHHAETWPTSLTVTLTDKPAVSIPELQVWMKRGEPARGKPMHNEMAYKSLVAMLLTKNLYFVGSWTLPNGKHSNNVLMFPVHNVGLVGAFFPLNGIPDMPQALPGNPSVIPTPANPTAPPTQDQPSPQRSMMQINAIMKQNGVGLPQTMIAQLAKMNPAEQNGWMKKLIQTGLEQRRHKLAAAAAAGGMGQQQQHKQPQQHQQDLGGFNPAQFALGGGPTGMGGAMGGAMGVGSSGMYPDIMASAGLPRTASNGGGGSGGAVSYEMMQSFMQRNQEIGGGPNAGN
ncbi:hypothetical protein B0H13DRAFT_1986044 [Mycena leptocephala]|nr:hypothetical protein B0H13DRAFT_1986044 [Mycena leptocephala]